MRADPPARPKAGWSTPHCGRTPASAGSGTERHRNRNSYLPRHGGMNHSGCIAAGMPPRQWLHEMKLPRFVPRPAPRAIFICRHLRVGTLTQTDACQAYQFLGFESILTHHLRELRRGSGRDLGTCHLDFRHQLLVVQTAIQCAPQFFDDIPGYAFGCDQTVPGIDVIAWVSLL